MTDEKSVEPVQDKEKRKKYIDLSMDALTLEELVERGEREELREKLKRYRKIVRSNKKPFGIAAGVVLLLLASPFIYKHMNAPRKGSIFYGACKNFIELYVEYPEYLRFADVREYMEDDSYVTRVWFTRLDPYGQYLMEPMECYYLEDPVQQFVMSKAMISKREVDQQLVDNYSKILPMVLNLEGLDITYPYDFPDKIGDLRFETDAFRRKIF